MGQILPDACFYTAHKLRMVLHFQRVVKKKKKNVHQRLYVVHKARNIYYVALYRSSSTPIVVTTPLILLPSPNQGPQNASPSAHPLPTPEYILALPSWPSPSLVWVAPFLLLFLLLHPAPLRCPEQQIYCEANREERRSDKMF